jgi:paraquat-inducible protein B
MAPDGQLTTEVPEALTPKRRRISIVWLIPLVAALVGGWLVYKTLTEQGPHITVSWETAEGLEAGKTKVKFRDVEVGLVDDISLAVDRTHVLVGIQMKKSAQPYLSKDTNFWIVRARLDASGVSGLSTILSGPYIEVEPGPKGDGTRRFSGLETAPVVRVDAPGRRFVLNSDKLGSLSARSPIYYRGFRVGEILGHELSGTRQPIKLYAFVKAPFDRLVLENSTFWNVSGVELGVGADGLKVKMESFQALLTGGVAFESSPDLPGATPAPEGKPFPLYSNYDAIKEAAIVEEVPFVLYFDGSVRGLVAGAPVEFRGVRVGTVKAIRPQIDLRQGTMRIAVHIALEPERLNGDADVVGSRQESPRFAFVSALVERGLRAQLKTGSLITGQQFVALDFFPDEPKKLLGLASNPPEIPTVPSTFAEIAESAARLLDKMGDLPLDLLVGDLRTAIGSVDATLQDARGLVKTTQKDLSPTLGRFRDAAEAAKGAMRQAETTLSSVEGSIGENSEVRDRIATTLRELGLTARSIRDFADYLERHPEALVKGKTGDSR